jgi:hypothetical protein
MRKITAIICLLSSVLCPLSLPAATNVYLDVTGAVLNERIAQIPTNTAAISNLESPVLSAGLADVGVVNQLVSTNFTETTFTDIDLSATVGTNAAVVGLLAHANSASTVLVRPNGRTNDVDATSATGVAIASGSDAYMVVNTDSSGVIEADVTASTDFTVLWFIRRHEF